MKLTELASLLNGEIFGNHDTEITGVSGIHEAKEGDITFIASIKYLKDIADSRASCVIVKEAVSELGIDMGAVDFVVQVEAPGWLASGLQRTARLLQTDIRDLFKQEGRLVDDEFLTDVFAVLIKTDMGVQAAGQIRDKLQADFRGRVVQMTDLLDSVKQQLKQLMAQANVPLHFAASGPTIIMVVGVNGSGKTTSNAKLARRFRTEGKRVVLGAGDTFRAAAVEQLTIWAQREGAEIVRGETGSDPASVAHRATSRAVELGAEICILDTAGRLQTQTNLMQELSKIRHVAGKVIPEAPHEVLLVLDAHGE